MKEKSSTPAEQTSAKQSVGQPQPGVQPVLEDQSEIDQIMNEIEQLQKEMGESPPQAEVNPSVEEGVTVIKETKAKTSVSPAAGDDPSESREPWVAETLS